jgi:hypothetical protein
MNECPKNRTYTFMPDWESTDDNVAMAYIGNRATIRLTDQQRVPLKEGSCTITNDASGKSYTIDSRGTVTVQLQDSSVKSIDLVWTAPNKSNEPWSKFGGTFFLDVRSKNDNDCIRRLTNLGFYGANETEQIQAFERYLGKTPTGNLASIRDALIEWHDGGLDPSKKEKLAAEQIGDSNLTDLYEAFYGEPFTGYKTKGKKFEDVYPIICQYREKGQISNLQRDWAAKFGTNLETVIYDTLKDEHLKKVLPRFYGVPDDKLLPYEYPAPPPDKFYDPNWVEQLHDAFKDGLFGWGTDEDKTYEILNAARKNIMMNKLRMEYNTVYGSNCTLEDEFYSELSQNGDCELQRALQPYYLGLAEAAQGLEVPCDWYTANNVPIPLPAGTCFCHGTLMPQYGFKHELDSFSLNDPLGPFILGNNLRPLFPDFFTWINMLNKDAQVRGLAGPQPATTSGSSGSSGSSSSSGLSDMMKLEFRYKGFHFTLKLPSALIIEQKINLPHGYHLNLEVKAETSATFSVNIKLDGMEDFTLAFNNSVTIGSTENKGSFGLRFDSTRLVDHVVIPQPQEVKDKVNTAIKSINEGYAGLMNKLHGAGVTNATSASTDVNLVINDPANNKKDDKGDGSIITIPPSILEAVDTGKFIAAIGGGFADIYGAHSSVTEPEKKKVSFWSVGLTLSLTQNKPKDSTVDPNAPFLNYNPQAIPLSMPLPQVQGAVMFDFTIHFP